MAPFQRTWTALAAGAAGTVTEAAWSALENRLLGERAVFDPSRMGARMLRHAGVDVPPRVATVLGSGMRAAYGPAWGLVLAQSMRWRMPWPARAAGLALFIWLFELAALPRVGATPPLREWPRGMVWLDASNALLYSCVACLVMSRLDES